MRCTILAGRFPPTDCESRHELFGNVIRRLLPAGLLMVLGGLDAEAVELRLLRAAPDPYGYPRPAPGAEHVPTRTSFFVQFGFDAGVTDEVLADSISLVLQDPEGEVLELLGPGMEFAPGYAGTFRAGSGRGPTWALNVDGQSPLRPATRYQLTVTARSREGATLEAPAGSWHFTTAEEADEPRRVEFSLDVNQPATRWHGGFFTGFCKPSFSTSASNLLPTYELMAKVRERAPRAWSLQRDFWPTGMQHQPRFISPQLPNVVRERETRRITAIEPDGDSVLLHVEDFFGHAQYGIEPARPLTGDFQVGDEILVADGVNHARAEVLEIVRDETDEKSLRVSRFDEPEEGWKIDYAGPLPEEELQYAPGLFPPGGCYLRKFRPAGTPRYYWGRIDQEWDIAQRQFGRRLVVNFADAPGDLSIDGQNWTYPKDYAQYHEVVHTMTTRLLDRYGDACLDFLWSSLNEPDLARAFWRSGDWDELQKFHDYTADAVLRAFEDKGYDSDQVMVGGLEIGAIFGVRIERPILQPFLAHCSPHAELEGALPYNAAMEDSRLEGKRSRRVTRLCQATGKGSPCDFVSVHAYNSSETMAAKLTRAKTLALETDPEFYAELSVHSLESCPGWNPPPDVAAADSYLGNGYFPTWCADVARRLLAQAAVDVRYNRGESILTFWPWPNQNFRGHNAATRVISVDDTGDGTADRQVTIAMPILHFLGLLAEMGDHYWVLPQTNLGGHVVSGFASPSDQATRLLVYSHQNEDIQSRSDNRLEVRVQLNGLSTQQVRVRQYRFDKEHNSYYAVGLKLRERSAGSAQPWEAKPDELRRLQADLESSEKQRQLAALERVKTLRDLPESIALAGMRLYEATDDEELRAAIEEVGRHVAGRQVLYCREELTEVQRLAELRITREGIERVEPDGTLRLVLELLSNGANYCVIEPVERP